MKYAPIISPFLFAIAVILFGCGGDTPDPTGKGGEFPWMVPTAAGSSTAAPPAPLCVIPGGESIAPVASCTWSTPTPVTPTPVTYGSVTASQVCDYYAPLSPLAVDTRAMVVSSGFTGGTRSAAAWVTWARHNADNGIAAYVCDVRHSAASGVNPFPAPPSDARCIMRTLAALSPTGHVRSFGASAGAVLADYADATADRATLTTGTTTITLDDGTCSLAWSAADAAIVTRVSLWSEPGDLRIKAKISSGALTNLDQYFAVTGESDPNWLPRATLASPVLWYRAGMAPRLNMASSGDFVVLPEQTLGTGAAGLTCTPSHPSGLTGTREACRAAGPNATSIANACPITTHLPAFAAPLTSGECTSDIF